MSPLQQTAWTKAVAVKGGRTDQAATLVSSEEVPRWRRNLPVHPLVYYRQLKDKGGVVLAQAASCAPLPGKWWEVPDVS